MTINKIREVGKITVISTLITFIQIIAGFTVNKLIAVSIGPSGLAIMGSFRNILQLTVAFGQGFIEQGIIRKVSEDFENLEKTHKNIKSILVINLLFSMVVVVVLLLLFLMTPAFLGGYHSYVLLLCISAFPTVLGKSILLINNGFKDTRLWLRFSILQSVISIIITIPLALFYQLEGALIGILSHQGVSGVLMLYVFSTRKIDYRSVLDKSVGLNQLKEWLPFIKISLITMLLKPIFELYIRNDINQSIGLYESGLWQATIFVSLFFVTFLSATFKTYYFPTLSRHDKKVRFMNFSCLVYILAGLVSLVVVSPIRDELVLLLFSDEFLRVSEYLKYQLIGDVFRVSAAVFGYYLITRTKTKYYLICEIVYYFTYILVIQFWNADVLDYIYAHVAACFGYFIVILTIANLEGLNEKNTSSRRV
jgi:O-antigen/teichoic acid export membrane protein